MSYIITKDGKRVKKRGRLLAVCADCGQQERNIFVELAGLLYRKHRQTDWSLYRATLQEPTCFYFLDWIMPHFISNCKADYFDGSNLRWFYKKRYYLLAAKIPGPQYKWAYDTALGFFMICMENQFDIHKKFAQLELNRFKRLDYQRERQRHYASKKRAS